MEIVIATNNKDKLIEYKNILKEFNIKCISLKELNIVCDPQETGTTFKENSLIKAQEIAKFTDKMIIADDSGIEVDELKGELGVYSHRFMGENTSYPEKCMEIIRRIEGKNRTARFVCCITLLNYKGQINQFEGVIEGSIGYELNGNNGFGYDPIFIPNGYSITTAEMSDKQKHSISHRGNAARLLVEFLKKEGV